MEYIYVLDVLNNLTDMLRSQVHNLGPDQEHSSLMKSVLDKLIVAFRLYLGLLGIRLLAPSVQFLILILLSNLKKMGAKEENLYWNFY